VDDRRSGCHVNEYVVVIRFDRYASDKDLIFYSVKLHEILEEKGITSYGHARFLGYNPPFQLIDRRNEIIVSVNWKAEYRKKLIS
jgi:hypothetical protein